MVTYITAQYRHEVVSFPFLEDTPWDALKAQNVCHLCTECLGSN